nr:FixH family protein [Auraticoccus cholistanensis]
MIGTDPAEGAVLATAPRTVTLTFDEPVSPAVEGAQWLAPDGSSTVLPATARDETVVVELPAPVPQGTSLLSWRVVSADGHPIAGVLTFSVGAPSENSGSPTAGSSSPWLSGTVVLARGLTLAGVLLLVGLVLFDRLVLRGAEQPPGMLRALRLSAWVAGLATLVVLPLGWVVQQGTGLAAVASALAWQRILADPATAATLMTAVGAVVAADLSSSAWGRRSESGHLATAVALAVVIGAQAVTGHTRSTSPTWLVVGADLVHVVVASAWVGGLLGLVLVLRRPAYSPSRADPGHPGPLTVVGRFSTLAAVSVAALAVTGTVLAVLVLETWDALLGTGYGRTLLVKLGLVGVALLLAGWNRLRLLPALAAVGDPSALLSRLRRTLLDELALLLAAVAVTGLLISSSPSTSAPPEPAATQLELAGDRADITLEPGVTGRNTVSVVLTGADGRPLQTTAAPTLRLTQPVAGVGPLTAPLTADDGGGRWTGEVDLPVTGSWEVQLAVRVDEFREPVGSGTVEVR